jgi:hypothetical protein
MNVGLLTLLEQGTGGEEPSRERLLTPKEAEDSSRGAGEACPAVGGSHSRATVHDQFVLETPLDDAWPGVRRLANRFRRSLPESIWP